MGYRPGTRRRLPLRGLPGSQVSSWLNFRPPTLPGLALWLDASDTATITASGSPLRVSQWDDKSGNGRNLVQANGANQPVSGATTINSLNAIDFTSGRRVSLTSTTLMQDVGGGTVFAVVKGTYSSAFAAIFNITANNATTTTRTYLAGNSGTIISGGRRLDANGFQSVASASVTNDTILVAGGIYDYSNAALRVRVGSEETLRSGGFQSAGNTSNTNSRILVGANDEGGEQYAGSVCELVVYERVLTAGEIQVLVTYLQNKWGTLP